MSEETFLAACVALRRRRHIEEQACIGWPDEVLTRIRITELVDLIRRAEEYMNGICNLDEDIEARDLHADLHALLLRLDP